MTGNCKVSFGPLTFEKSILPSESQRCLLCNQTFDLRDYSEFLKHIFEVHHLVIEGVQGIEKLGKYLEHWQKRFAETGIETTVPNIRIDGTEQRFFVLSTLLQEDKKLRHKLKLESVLEQQEFERTSNDFKRNCLFCKLEFEGKRIDFVKHLSCQHNIHLGKAENLVYIEEFLTEIEDKINNLKCIYCEKTFTSRTVLKEHMRKKLHKRINPANHFYDKFYVVNYLEIDRNWQHIEQEDDTVETNDDEWSDWNERDQEIMCLFCDYKDYVIDDIYNHIKRRHGFDFQKSIENLDFYQKVKLVNYVRRQLYVCRCYYCDKSCEGKDSVLAHLEEENHFLMPDTKLFDQPEYYFPTYENDTLLYYLDEINEN